MRSPNLLYLEKIALGQGLKSSAAYYLESDVLINLISGQICVYSQMVKTLNIVGYWEDVSFEIALDASGQMVHRLTSAVETQNLLPFETYLIPAGTAFTLVSLEPSEYTLAFLPIQGIENHFASQKPTAIPFDILADFPTMEIMPASVPSEGAAPEPPQPTFLHTYDYIADLKTRDNRMYYADESALALKFGIYCALPFIALIFAAIITSKLAMFAFIATLPIGIHHSMRLKTLINLHAPTLEITKSGLIFYTESYTHLYVPWSEISSLSIEPYGKNDIGLAICIRNKGNYVKSLEPVRRFLAKTLLKDANLSEDLRLTFNRAYLSDSVENVKFAIMKAQYEATENNSQNIL